MRAPGDWPPAVRAVTAVALRGLDPAWAPPGTWLATGARVVALLLVTARLTRSEAR